MVKPTLIFQKQCFRQIAEKKILFFEMHKNVAVVSYISKLAALGRRDKCDRARTGGKVLRKEGGKEGGCGGKCLCL